MSRLYKAFELQSLFDDFDDLSIDAKMEGLSPELEKGDQDLLSMLYPQRPTPKIAKVADSFTVRSARELHSRGFRRVASSPNMLVRISDQDFWEMEKGADGGLVVKRLFDPNGNPVKA